jgi:peptide/nickel transport system substrate-binding protein
MSPTAEFDRRSFIRTLTVLGGVALLTPVIAGCAPTAAAPGVVPTTAFGTPKKGGSAVLAIQDDPVNMDPADGQIYASIQVYDNIFSKLIEVDKDFKFVPDLATSWKQDDPLTWSFTLVKNAVFHNGEPLTAKDVAFSINRMKTHSLGAFVASFDTVEVIDDYHFKIHLTKPYGAMEATLASFVNIVNKTAVTTMDPKESPIGSGPYKMTEWVKGSHVKLERWEKYYKSDKPYLDSVTFQSVPDDSVRLAGLQTKQFDWVQTVPQQQIKTLESSSTIAHTAAKAYFPYLIEVNTTAAPFDNKLVRQAVNWAIDRSDIVKLAFSGQAAEATEAVAKGNPFFSGADFYAGGPDLKKAKALIKQANLTTNEYTILVETEDSAYTTIAQVLLSQLSKIGLKGTISTASASEYFGRLATQKYGLGITYFSASMDPALTYFLLGQSTSGFNFTGYKSPTLDAALEKFTFEPDQVKRKAYYPTMVKLFQEESPFIFVANQYQEYWTSKKLGGAAPLPNLDIRVEDMWQAS